MVMTPNSQQGSFIESLHILLSDSKTAILSHKLIEEAIWALLSLSTQASMDQANESRNLSTLSHFAQPLIRILNINQIDNLNAILVLKD